MWADLRIRTESGEDVIAGQGIETVRQEVSPTDMQMLDCGSVSGQVIDFSAPMTEWPFDLNSGKYRVQACVTSTLTEFIDTHDEWGKAFRETKAASKIRQAAVRDFSSCSAWTALTVR